MSNRCPLFCTYILHLQTFYSFQRVDKYFSKLQIFSLNTLKYDSKLITKCIFMIRTFEQWGWKRCGAFTYGVHPSAFMLCYCKKFYSTSHWIKLYLAAMISCRIKYERSWPYETEKTNKRVSKNDVTWSAK